jgi:hypothetical protein
MLAGNPPPATTNDSIEKGSCFERRSATNQANTDEANTNEPSAGR